MDEVKLYTAAEAEELAALASPLPEGRVPAHTIGRDFHDKLFAVLQPTDDALLRAAPGLARSVVHYANEVERLRALVVIWDQTYCGARVRIDGLRAQVAALRAGQDEAVAAAVAKERADVVAFLLARSACRAAERDEARSEGMRQRRGGAAADLSDAAEEVEAGNHARPGGGES